VQLIVNTKRYDDPSPLNLMGGEGELYALSTDNVAKVYHQEVRSDERKRKVLALCNSFQNDAAKGGSTSVAFPLFPAYELVVSLDTLVGFSMRWFKNCPAVAALGYNLSTNDFNEDKGVRFDTNTALGFAYNLFEAVDQLHQGRIILGDVNPANILYNPATRRPVIIDVDSAQIGGFACPTTHELYNDPKLQQRGKNLGGSLTFDAGTDTFALAVVCFELLVGVRPYQLYVTPTNPKGEVENKFKGISSIRCVEIGRHWLSQLGVGYLDCPENRAVETRLAQLKTADRRLYDFFVGVFVNDERENLLFSLPLADPRHPGNRFLVESGFKKVVDDEAKKRQRYTAVQAKQGVAQRHIGLPDSGFRNIIDSLGAKTAATTVAKKRFAGRKAPQRADPPGFEIFLQQFGLGV
jgi:serine/threonine protein kinase